MESLGVFLGGVGVFFIGVAALWWVSKKYERLARIRVKARESPHRVNPRRKRHAVTRSGVRGRADETGQNVSLPPRSHRRGRRLAAETPSHEPTY